MNERRRRNRRRDGRRRRGRGTEGEVRPVDVSEEIERLELSSDSARQAAAEEIKETSAKTAAEQKEIERQRERARKLGLETRNPETFAASFVKKDDNVEFHLAGMERETGHQTEIEKEVLEKYIPELIGLQIREISDDDEDQSSLHFDENGVLRIPKEYFEEAADKKAILSNRQRALDLLTVLIEKTAGGQKKIDAAKRSMKQDLPGLAKKYSDQQFAKFRKAEDKIISAQNDHFESVQARLGQIIDTLRKNEAVDLTAPYAREGEDGKEVWKAGRRSEYKRHMKQQNLVFYGAEEKPGTIDKQFYEIRLRKRIIEAYYDKQAQSAGRVGKAWIGFKKGVNIEWQEFRPVAKPIGGIAVVGAGAFILTKKVLGALGGNHLWKKAKDAFHWLTFGGFKEGKEKK